MRKHPTIKLAWQLSSACGSLKVLLQNVDKLTGCLNALRFLKVLDKKIMKIQARLTTYEGIVAPSKVRKKLPGEHYQWEKYDSPNRCWACKFMGGFRCDNPFLNRKACTNFEFNETLQKHPKRLEKQRKEGFNKLEKLKLLEIKSFSQHVEKCKYCAKALDSKRGNPLEKMSRHYQKYRMKRIKRVSTKMAFFGIAFSPIYILPWED